MPLPPEAPLELQWMAALRTWLATEAGVECVSYLPVATNSTPIMGLWVDSDFAAGSRFASDYTRQQLMVVVLSIRDTRVNTENALVRWANYLIEDVFRQVAIGGVPVTNGVGFVGIRGYAGTGNSVMCKRAYSAVGGDAASNAAIVDGRLTLQYIYTLPGRFC